MLGVYKQYHLMREESEGGRRHEILCDVRQRVGVAFDRGKEGSKNCVSRPVQPVKPRCEEVNECLRRSSCLMCAFILREIRCSGREKKKS